MFETLVSAPYMPFTAALALLAALVVLELALLLVGGSLIGGAEVDAELDLSEIDAAETAAPSKPDAAPSGLASLLGLGKVPLLIWLGAFLAGFGLSGYTAQTLTQSLLGLTAPALALVPLAAVAGIGIARVYGAAFARLIPGTETSAQSAAALSRLRGVVSQGTARAGQPAEVRVTDRHGNLQFLRAEPLDRSAEIRQGQEVLVLRLPSGPDRGAFRIVAVSD